jgi:VWFA-related protein
VSDSPRPRARTVLAVAVAASAGLVAAAGRGQQPPRHTESVTVSRVLIDARVVDARGEPIRNLSAAHFKVRIDGKPARVESALWVGDGGQGAAAPLPAVPAGQDFAGLSQADTSTARLIVLVFQKDLDSSRIIGFMRMLINMRPFLDSLGPDDRVAVLSFDSRLRIWLDFTASMDEVRDVLERGLLFKDPPRVERASPPSLVSTLDLARAGRASSMEQALAVLGRALEGLPGSKSVVLVGHGFGRRVGSTIQFEDSYDAARRALQSARASVFCLDVTDAAWHTLDAGLQMTAEDTGGFFLRTHEFSKQAMSRLAGALSGYYVLFVEITTPVARETHNIAVQLDGVHNGRVLAKRSYDSE